MKEMKTLTIDGQTYEVVDAVARDAIYTPVIIRDIDYSEWENGSFSMTTDTGVVITGSVVFDSNRQPTSVTLGGHTMTVTFPA